MAKPEMRSKPQQKPEQGNKLHIHMPQLDQVIELLESIDEKLTQQAPQPPMDQGEIMAALDDLKAEVEANTNAVDSASRLISGLADQLEEAIAAQDPAAVQAVVDQLRENNATLAEAVGANTEVNPL